MTRRRIVLVAAISLLSAFTVNAQTPAPGTLASAQPPVYPLSAKAAGIEGTVTLKGTIGADGKLTGLHAVSGPPELYQAAIDATRQWVYHPYTDDHGVPVAVPTIVTVNFSFGGKKKKAKAMADAQAAIAAQTSRAPTQPSTPE